MEKLNKNGIIEVLAMVKAGVMTPIKDNYGNIISVNVTANPELKIKDVQYVKHVCGNIVMGSTPEELDADEKALRDFMDNYAHTDVLHLIRIANVLNKETLTEEDVAYLNRELQYYVERHKEVVTREVKVPCERPEPTRGAYPDLLENLYVLSIDTLKGLKNEANRNGGKDLYNACRKVLRSKGYMC